MAGTNDLSNRRVSPEDLIESTDEYITQTKGFSNVGKIFICKIPPRCDFHAVNLKVSEYSSLLVERFDNTEEFLEVIDTIKPEIRFIILQLIVYLTRSLHLAIYPTITKI